VEPRLTLNQMLEPRTRFLPEDSAEPTIYAGIKSQCDFHLRSNCMSNRLLSATGVPAEDALAMNKDLDAWSETLPPYFEMDRKVSCRYKWYLFAKTRLWWRFWNMKIIIFRHILLRSAMRDKGEEPQSTPNPADAKCRETCIAAAHESIISIHNFLDGVAPSKFVGWYAM